MPQASILTFNLNTLLMNIKSLAIIGLVSILNFSCTKYLDKVPDKSLTIPSTLHDLKALLNDEAMTLNSPAFGDFSCDDWNISFITFQSLPPQVRNAYTWQSDIFEGASSFGWNSSYYHIYVANIVLENITKVSADITDLSVKPEYKEIKGRAFFLRAFSYYNLSQLFIVPYDSTTSNTDLGLPLRLHSDPNQKVKRSSVEATYRQMIEDAIQAKDLLGATVNKSTPNIPSKAAAFALLSRIYLNMGNYQKAGVYADSSLSLYSVLIDYNILDTTKRLIFPRPTNGEVLYMATEGNYFSPYLRFVDSSLYKSYSSEDLRKTIFFNKNEGAEGSYFRGSYSGTYYLFCGLATNELYLIRAECNARMGKIESAMNDLNTLLKKRYRAGSFNKRTATNVTDALTIILAERRKELIFRGIRWSDLRRLNKSSRFEKTLVRKLRGQTYTLPPNDAKYTFPIPQDEISLGGIQQNER